MASMTLSTARNVAFHSQYLLEASPYRYQGESCFLNHAFFLYLLPTEGGFKLPELIRKQFNDYFWKVKVHMIRQFHFHFENMVYFYCFWKRRLKLCLHLAEISLCDWLGIWLLEHLSLNSWDSDVALSRSQWGENR